MSMRLLEIILIVKKISLYSTIGFTILLVLNMTLILNMNISNYRRFEWTKERFKTEIGKPIGIRGLMLLVTLSILIVFYYPVDLMDEEMDYDLDNIYEMSPDSGKRQSKDWLEEDDKEKILSLLSGLKGRRSLKSGALYIEDPTLFIEMWGMGPKEQIYRTFVITDQDVMVMGSNIDFRYQVDGDAEAIYNQICTILENGKVSR